jgi:hypothetical protein
MKNVYIAALIVLGTVTGLLRMLSPTSPTSPSAPNPKEAVVSLPQKQPSSKKADLLPLSSPTIVRRPIVADNGSPFPADSGYIAKYPQKFTDGYSSVTIDNSKNSADLFLKLFSLDSKPPIPVSVFLVKAKDVFTVQDVRSGRYEVRYQSLDTGRLSKTEPFELKEVQVSDGVQFSKLTLTLYQVQNGNMETYPISAAEFN